MNLILNEVRTDPFTDPDCVKQCNLDALNAGFWVVVGGATTFGGAAMAKSAIGAAGAAVATGVGLNAAIWWRDHMCIPRCPKKCL